MGGFRRQLGRPFGGFHTDPTFDVIPSTDYADFLSELTGFPSGDYAHIAISEFVSLI